MIISWNQFPSLDMSLSIPHGLITSPIFPIQRPKHNPNTTLSLRSSKTSAPNLRAVDEEEGIPLDDVKILAKFKSQHNYIRVLEVSRKADHELAGARLLLLDSPGNIHSVSYLMRPTTDAYYDVLGTLPPVLPLGPVGVLGFGAGSTARLILESYPEAIVHGWELDPSVIAVARAYFNLDRLERRHPDRLFIHIGDALEAQVGGGFSGLVVDLFGEGQVVPELQLPGTWRELKKRLRRGGSIMANVGGSCVEPVNRSRNGREIMEETLEAMHAVFPDSLYVMSLGNERVDDSTLAFAGALPEVEKWKRVLPSPLKMYAGMWRPYRRRG